MHDIEISFDTNEAGDVITLKMTDITGERITNHDFILTLEMYLSDLARAHNERVTTKVELQ